MSKKKVMVLVSLAVFVLLWATHGSIWEVRILQRNEPDPEIFQVVGMLIELSESRTDSYGIDVSGLPDSLSFDILHTYQRDEHSPPVNIVGHGTIKIINMISSYYDFQEKYEIIQVLSSQDEAIIHSNPENCTAECLAWYSYLRMIAYEFLVKELTALLPGGTLVPNEYTYQRLVRGKTVQIEHSCDLHKVSMAISSAEKL